MPILTWLLHLGEDAKGPRMDRAGTVERAYEQTADSQSMDELECSAAATRALKTRLANEVNNL